MWLERIAVTLVVAHEWQRLRPSMAVGDSGDGRRLQTAATEGDCGRRQRMAIADGGDGRQLRMGVVVGRKHTHDINFGEEILLTMPNLLPFCRHSLKEVLDAPNVMNMIKDTEAAKEVQALKDFFNMLSNVSFFLDPILTLLLAVCFSRVQVPKFQDSKSIHSLPVIVPVIVRTVNCGQSWDICSSNSRIIFIGIVNL
nr:protein PELOTA 1 [Ipomoea batatas]